MNKDLKEEYIDDFFVLLSYYLIMLCYAFIEVITKTNTFLIMGLLVGYIYLGMWCYKSYKKDILPMYNKVIKIVLVAIGILPIFVLSLSYSTIEMGKIILSSILGIPM